MLDPVYSIVFTTAFLGSGHCIGMCGPVVAALSLSRPGRRRGFLFHLVYNAGRITTYVFIGIAAGWIGSLLSETRSFSIASHAILILADIFVILIGLRTGGLFKRLRSIRLEMPGSVQAMTGAVVMLQRLPEVIAAFPIGLVMGFLPCGFLYAIALAAAGRGDALQGGFIMLAFGLGTLPAILLFGSAVHWLSSTMRAELLRWAGFMVVCIGLYNAYRHFVLAGLLQ